MYWWTCLEPCWSTRSSLHLFTSSPRPRTGRRASCAGMMMMMKWCLMSSDVSWHIRGMMMMMMMKWCLMSSDVSWHIRGMMMKMMMKWCLMSSDVSWHIRDKLWPMLKHGRYSFTSMETRRLVRTDSPDGHLDSHVAADLWVQGLKWRVFYTLKNTASVAQNLE